MQCNATGFGLTLIRDGLRRPYDRPLAESLENAKVTRCAIAFKFVVLARPRSNVVNVVQIDRLLC